VPCCGSVHDQSSLFRAGDSVNVSAVTNYVECHCFTNPTIDLVYKTPWYLHPTNHYNDWWPRRHSMHHPEHHLLLGPAISSFALQLCCKWIGALRQNTDRLCPSGPDKYFTGLLGHSTCLFILPYRAGILGVTRAGWYPSCLNNDHPSVASISRTSRQTRRGERTRGW